jgi:hypothetical protein
LVDIDTDITLLKTYSNGSDIKKDLYEKLKGSDGTELYKKPIDDLITFLEDIKK